MVGTAARAAFGVGRAAGRLSRLTGRGRGGTIPGRVALQLRPDALEVLTRGRAVLLVTGTNGKSTTTSLLAASAGVQGPVVTNADGANLHAGLVTALLPPTSATATAVLEVDEVVLPLAVRQARPRAVVLLNLSRDQLDRSAEVALHVARWSAVLGVDSVPTVVANGADPLVVQAVRAARPDEHGVVWVDAGAPWRGDVPLCPACGAMWDPERTPWACDRCGAAMPACAWRLDGTGTVVDPGGTAHALGLGLPGRAVAANAAMALAAVSVLGVPVPAALERCRTVRQVDGRYLDRQVDGRQVRLLLAKNPAGWLEVLENVDSTRGTVVLALNARTADGTDPSWLWDVPFERLQGREVVVCGERRLDLSVRLHYGGVPHRTVPDTPAALDATRGEDVVVAATYTAFVAARAVLTGAA